MNRRFFSLLLALALVALAIFLLSRVPEDTDATGEPASHKQEKHLAVGDTQKKPSHSPDKPPRGYDIDAPLTDAEESQLGDILANKSLRNIEAAGSFLSLAVDPTKSAALRFNALEHALNLLPEDQASALSPLIAEQTTPTEMVDSILDYAMNIDIDTTALDLGIQILESPHEDQREASHEMVAFILDVDSDVDSATLLVEAKKELAKMLAEDPPPP